MPHVVVVRLLGHGNGTAWDAFFLFLVSAIRRKQRRNRGRKGAQKMTPSEALDRHYQQGKYSRICTLIIRSLMTRVGPFPLMNTHVICSGFRHMISAPGNNLTSQKKSAEFHDIVKQKASQSDPKIDKKKDDPLTANQI